MGGGGDSQVVGYKYYAGMHMALCHSPIDRLTRIQVDLKTIFLGSNSGGRIRIDQPGLFGGETREGGIVGDVDIEMGEDSQDQNDYLQSQLVTDIPAFRGILGIVLRRLYLGVNPYLKKWSFRGQRVFIRQNGVEQWYPEKAPIRLFDQAASGSIASGLPCHFHVGETSCNCQSADSNSIQVPTKFSEYLVTIRVRGITELFTYTGGESLGGTLYKNPTNTSVDINSYWIETSDSSDVYYVNNGTFTPTLSALDFTFNIIVTQGALITIHGDSFDDSEIRNFSALTVTDSDPSFPILFSQPYDGQFIQTDVRFDFDHIDMNPAHIIRECLTDPIWGMGYPESEIDDDSFMASANTLFDEAFGISLLWDRQIQIKDFITEIIRHIDGALYIDRQTGKFFLKLIRFDYDIETLITLDPSNSKKITNFSQPTVGELINSISVNFWDYKTGNQASVTVEDPALIQMQGAVINTTIQYPGFTHMGNGSKAATRDLKALSTPLKVGQIETGMIAKDFNIGDVFKITWPEYEIDTIIVRATKVSFGDGKNNAVKMSFVQDKFDFVHNPVVIENPDEWQPPGGPPTPVDDQITEEITYFEMVQNIGQTEANIVLATTPTAGFIGVSAPRPENGINARYWIDEGGGFEDKGPMEFSPYATLLYEIYYTDSTISLGIIEDIDTVIVGTYGSIGNELIRFDSLDSELGTITIGRGVLDTYPEYHAAGSNIIFWDTLVVSNLEEYQTPEIISAKITPTTSEGTMDIVDAVGVPVEFNSRAIRPFLPGNIDINSLSLAKSYVPTSTYITWVGRDRVQQTGPLIDFFDGNIGPEAGTTWDLELYDEDAVLLDSLLDTVLTEFYYPQDDEKTALNKSVLSGDGIFDTISPDDDSSLEAYYPASGLSGSSLPDDSGEGNDATATNITASAGDTGLIFNGSITSHVEIPNVVMDGASQYALSLWLNIEDQVIETAILSIANALEFEDIYFGVDEQFFLKEAGNIAWENKGPTVLPLKAKTHVVLVRESE